MLRNFHKINYLKIAVSSILALQNMSAANFSVESSNASGIGSLGDVIRSSNAIFTPDDSFNTLYFRALNAIDQPLPTIRQNICFHIPQQGYTKVLVPLSGSSRFQKSGSGTLELNNQVSFAGDVVIKEGQLVVASPHACSFPGILNNAKLTISNPAYLKQTQLNLADKSRTHVLEGGALQGLVSIQGETYLDISSDPVTLSYLSGEGILNKIGQGKLILSEHTDFKGQLKLKEGSVVLKNGFLDGSILCDGGSLEIATTKAYQNYQLQLKHAKLNLRTPVVVFKEMITNAGSDADIFLNHSKTYLKKGLSGWGVLRFHGPGDLFINQNQAFCGHIYFNDLNLETTQLAKNSYYNFKNVALDLEDNFHVDEKTILDVTEGSFKVNQNSHDMTCDGTLQGRGKIEFLGTGNTHLKSCHEFEGEIYKQMGRLNSAPLHSKLIIDREAIYQGIGDLQSFDLKGAWLARIEPDIYQTGMEAKKATISGKIIIQPAKGLYKPQEYTLIKGSDITLDGGVVLAPSQFEGVPAHDKDGLKFRLKEFHTFSGLIDDKFSDHKALMKHLEENFIDPLSKMDPILGELIKLKSDQTAFLRAVDSLQPAYFSALGLVQESNFILARSSLSNRMQELMSFPCANKYISDKNFCFWIDPVGDFTQQEPRQHDMGYHAASVGAFVGFDGIVHEDVRFGVTSGYTNSRVDWMQNVGKGWINSAYFGAYFLYKPNHFYLNGSMNGGYSHYSAKRNIKLVDLKAKARHKNHGLGFSSDLEFGYIIVGKTKTQPFLRQSYIGLYQSRFTENGAGALDLNVNSKYFSMYRVEGGFVFNRCLDYSTFTFVPEVSLSGIYEIELNKGTFHATYVDTQESYDVVGMKPSRLLFSPGASLDFLLKKHDLTLGVRYHAELCPQFYDQRISGHIGYSF
jgi:autotransporter-associated beta strand protein